MSHLLLLDWSNFVMRTYHRAGCTSPAAVVSPVERALQAVLRELKPDYAVACLDPRPGEQDSLRYQLYPHYKGKEVPPEISAQEVVESTIYLLDGMGFCHVSAPGYEGDDVIVTLATRALEKRHEVSIHSNDRDLWQLVTDAGIRVLCPDRGQTHIVHEGKIMAAWGIRPSQVVAFKVLIGDDNDNLPRLGFTPEQKEGQKKPWGFTERRATALLKEHQSMRGIVKARDTLPPAEQTWIRNAQEDPVLPLALRGRLVTLVRDVPLTLDRTRLSVRHHWEEV